MVKVVGQVVGVPLECVMGKLLGMGLDEGRREVHDRLIERVVGVQGIGLQFSIVIDRFDDKFLIRRPIGFGLAKVWNRKQSDTSEESGAESFAGERMPPEQQQRDGAR